MFKEDFHVAVSIVTWNSEKYINQLLGFLDNQTFKDFQIIVTDNASSDGSLEAVRSRNDIIVIKNSTNLGFSRGHNKGIEMAMKCWEGKDLSERFVFIVNPDIIPEPDCLERLLISICRDKTLAAIAPKMLRFTEESIDNLMDFKKTNTIDSLGVDIYKSRKLMDRGAGNEYKNDSKIEEVFGLSGAFMCLRASALVEAKIGKEYFDEDFFAYKEDADMAWRLRNLGWGLAVDCDATVYHARGAKATESAGLWKQMSGRKNKSDFVRFLSARNHLWTILKNDRAANIFFDFPFIAARESAKFLFNLFFDRSAFRGYLSALGGAPKILAKRSYLKNARTSAAEIRSWIK
jgi:GT2 family glycosyltransferase